MSSYGAKVGTNGGKITVSVGEDLKEFPIETVENLVLFPGVNVTQALLENCSQRKISVFWLNKGWKTYGSLYNPGVANVLRQKKQFSLMDDEKFACEFSKIIIKSKIKNQMVVAKRFCKEENIDCELQTKEMQRLIKRVSDVDSESNHDFRQEIEGCEGYAAKIYFELLKELVPPEFGFEQRTKHPPLDCFSALLSFLYTLLYNNIISAINLAGLSPDIGFMHALSKGHAALASDMMEEYRAIVCDSVALHLIRYNLSLDDFTFEDNGSVYLNHASIPVVVSAFEKKLSSSVGYLKKNGTGMSFRDSFSTQVYELLEAIETGDAKHYKPIKAR